MSVSFAANRGVCFEAMFAMGSAKQSKGCRVLLTGKKNVEFVIEVQIGTHCVTLLPVGNYTLLAIDILPNGSLYSEPALTTTFEITGRITHLSSTGKLEHVR